MNKMRIIPRQHLYKCIKCKKFVVRSEIEEERCPFCLHVTMKHKGCDGTVIEWNLDIRMR